MNKRKSTLRHNELLTSRKNYFGNGGDKDKAVSWGAIGAVGSEAAKDVAGMIKDINSTDVKLNTENLIENANSQQMGFANNEYSYDSLMSDMRAYNPLGRVTYEDMGGMSGGQMTGHILGNTLEGAASGAGLGPIGIAAGAVGGLITSAIGAGARKRKIKQAVLEVNSAIDDVNAFNERSFANRADNIATNIHNNMLANYAAFGGELNTQGGNFGNGVLQVNTGGTHETNPYEGVPMGVDPQGVPNLVEEGEVIYNDYVFSNRLKVPDSMRKKYKLGGPLTFARAAEKMRKEAEERPNDPISKNGLEAMMSELAAAQESVRQSNNKRKYSRGGGLVKKFSGEESYPSFLDAPAGWDPTTLTNSPTDLSWINDIDMPDDLRASYIDGMKAAGYDVSGLKKSSKPRQSLGSRASGLLSSTGLRYIPAFASGIMATTDALGWTNKPDLSDADAILDYSKQAGVYQPVSFRPVGNYLTYNPFDTEFAANKANAESAAARRAIMNTSGGNRATAMAGILAADNNALNQLGILRRGAAEDNRAHRKEVEEFNRATNEFNSEGFLKADMANQAALMQSKDVFLKGAIIAAELRQKERQAAAATRSANLSNFINSLGDIGRENFARNMIVSDPSKYYTIDASGNITYKSSFDDLSDAEQDYVTGHATRKAGEKKAHGGYLTIKRKR